MKYNRTIAIMVYIFIQASPLQAMQSINNFFASLLQIIGKKRESSLIIPDPENPLNKLDNHDLNYFFEQDNLKKLQQYVEPKSKITSSMSIDGSENSQSIEDYIAEKTKRENFSELITQYVSTGNDVILQQLTNRAFIDIYIHDPKNIHTTATNKESDNIFTYDENNNVIAVSKELLRDINDRKPFIYFSFKPNNYTSTVYFSTEHPELHFYLKKTQRGCIEYLNPSWSQYINSYHNGWAYSRWHQNEQDEPIVYKNPDTPESSTEYVKRKYQDALHAQKSQYSLGRLWRFIRGKNIYNDDVAFWAKRVRERTVIERLQNENKCTPSEAVTILAVFKELYACDKEAKKQYLEARNRNLPKYQSTMPATYNIIKARAEKKFQDIQQKELGRIPRGPLFKAYHQDI
ncbi:MAG TPA: hypothetical protein VGW78_05930 [Candidatus Babeliales bacterium]|jgi:hypothetical protein|nr:hypothetical protein [Candidatus Babeliales bacterium]